MDIDCLRCERARSLFDNIRHRFSLSLVATPRFVGHNGNRWARRALNGWEFSSITTIQSGRPFSVWNGASAAAGGDYNRDAGGGAVGGGFYDRPNAPLSPAEQIALSYADALTQGIHNVSDADFQRVRAFYNDSQIVELTMTVCFLNYFTRMTEALNLPVEQWALDGPVNTPASVATYRPPSSRVALISDDEMAATSTVAAAAKEQQKPATGLGLGLANSQRAMLRVPALAMAWRAYGTAVRDKFSITRDIQLQIRFSVSMANGCRYCTLHQVLGLRRLGVEPAKLVAMKKDDTALTPRELTAVTFARKVTRDPASVSDEDFRKLKAEFGEQGALEVLLQTCNFSFMNRLTDGLRLPSEDEAVRVYRETYGADWQF